MNAVKTIRRLTNILWLVLFAALFLSVSAYSQEPESLIASAKGDGVITTPVDELKITAALIVLRGNGTMLITVNAGFQLLAEGTWKADATSPEQIVLIITGGALQGELIGSGKLLLTNNKKTIKEFTINAKSPDGQKISVSFVGANSGQRDGIELGEPLCGPRTSEEPTGIKQSRNGVQMTELVNTVSPLREVGGSR